jgi:hypothetical protein
MAGAVQQGYLTDPQAQALLATLASGELKNKYHLTDGVIRYKGQVWLGNNTKIQEQVMLALHSSPLGDHSGFLVTYKRLKALLAWPRMKQDVHLFVTSYTIFKQTKPERVKYPGLFMPLQIPPHVWHTVSLDFIEGLPCSTHHNCIQVVVDK